MYKELQIPCYAKGLGQRTPVKKKYSELRLLNYRVGFGLSLQDTGQKERHGLLVELPGFQEETLKAAFNLLLLRQRDSAKKVKIDFFREIGAGGLWRATLGVKLEAAGKTPECAILALIDRCESQSRVAGTRSSNCL